MKPIFTAKNVVVRSVDDHADKKDKGWMRVDRGQFLIYSLGNPSRQQLVFNDREGTQVLTFPFSNVATMTAKVIHNKAKTMRKGLTTFGMASIVESERKKERYMLIMDLDDHEAFHRGISYKEETLNP